MRDAAEQALEEFLVLSAQAGEAEAFEQLIRRWQPRVWRHARLLCDDDAGAWDAVQEAWTAITKGLLRLDDPAGFGPWAMRIVTNKCADAVRERSRRRELAQAVAARPQRDNAVQSNADNDETLRAAVRSLPDGLRAAVSLYYGCGLSIAHTGAALAIPAGTVKSRLSEARERLRVILERTEP